MDSLHIGPVVPRLGGGSPYSILIAALRGKALGHRELLRSLAPPPV
jgi:hypothetical protein